ncbi:MAG: alanine--tRNA ligase, partial [bacterium]
FQPLIRVIASMAAIAYGSDHAADIAMRVIADHTRAIAFSIADGQLPSNVKAGYVIRRILRRALRYGYTFLGFREPFINKIVPVLVKQMEGVFPELKSQESLITHVIREEEASFLRTLATGIQRFNAYIDQHKINDYLQSSLPEDNDQKKTRHSSLVTRPLTIDGSFAFELYDTYGFPIDLTLLMAREICWSVDMEGFSKGLEEQKARSRQAATVDASDWTILQDETGMTEFLGYDTLTLDTEITRYRKITARGDTLFQIVLAQTPFYAESGGQVGDRGWLFSGGEKIEIINTIRENELIIHLAKKIFTDPSGPLTAKVDESKRNLTADNHTATHLLHAALRQVLGKHVEQKGSLVDEEHLRFDFTHFAKMTREEILQVERLVNKKIRENILLIEERALPVAKAKEMGAMALFGEKYGDLVRVITFDRDYSVELCGGTHVPATGKIGQVKIISEGAIAAGIRRIEAITGEKAEKWWEEKQELLYAIEESLKNPKDLLKSISSLLEENQALKKQVAEADKVKILQLKESLKKEITEVSGIHFLALKVDLDAEQVKSLGWELSKEIADLYLVLANESDGKAGLTVMVSENLVKERKMNAGAIIRELAKEIKGGGGGQPHIATAGGKEPAGIPAALAKAREYLPSDE